MEAIVDAYGAEEQAMGWYYYFDDKLSFPFLTQCIARRAISLCWPTKPSAHGSAGQPE